MANILSYRRYALDFRVPVRTSRGSWARREGLIVRLENEEGSLGWGEAAPIPGVGDESVDRDEEVLRRLGGRLEGDQIGELPEELPCLRHALEAAAVGDSSSEEDPEFLPVAALLPAGRSALEALPGRLEAGFRTFKWKVGLESPQEELPLLDDLCSLLPEGARLRLDANGAWDRRAAERWLERCAERPVEFVEQPTRAVGSGDGSAGEQANALLRGLAEDYPVLLALDESIAGAHDLDRWLEAGWPGLYVIKPLLHGAVGQDLGRLARAGADVVFSSVLETAVGQREALRWAFAWREAPGKPRRALGFGVNPLFSDSRCNGPATGPFFYRSQFEQLAGETVWNALS